MKLFVKNIMILMTICTGSLMAADSFKVKITGHGQVKVKPDAIGTSFQALTSCAKTKKASEKASEAQLKKIKDVIRAKISDFDIEVHANTSESARIQRTAVKGTTTFPAKYYFSDTCAKEGEDKVELSELVDSQGNIAKKKLGTKWATRTQISVTTSSKNTRALQDALQEMVSISFDSVIPAGTSFQLSLPRRAGAMTRPVVSKELREKNKVKAQKKSDENAMKLLEVFKGLGFDQVPGSKMSLSRDTQVVSAQHIRNDQGEITAQTVGLDLTVVTEAMKDSGIETEVNVVVNAEKTFSADYYESRYAVSGNCFETKAEAVAARKEFVKQMDANVMVKYQGKTPVKGVDRQDPRDVRVRNVKDNLITVSGRQFTSEQCVLVKGASLADWTGKDNKEFWSFTEVYVARNQTETELTKNALAGVKSSVKAVAGLELNSPKIFKKYLSSKEKGKNRTEILSKLSEKEINDQVCDSLGKDEFSGTSGTIVVVV